MFGRGNKPALERLKRVVGAYGANPNRWPARDREAMLLLLEELPEVRAMRDEAARLDALLDLAPVEEPSAGLAEAILSQLPGRIGEGGWKEEQALGERVAPEEGQAGRSSVARRCLAAAVPLAAAAVVALWLTGALKSRHASFTEDQLARLGEYTTPTDVLLEPIVVDLVGTVPSLDCSKGELGCPDWEMQAMPQSWQPHNRRNVG